MRGWGAPVGRGPGVLVDGQVDPGARRDIPVQGDEAQQHRPGQGGIVPLGWGSLGSSAGAALSTTSYSKDLKP